MSNYQRRLKLRDALTAAKQRVRVAERESLMRLWRETQAVITSERHVPMERFGGRVVADYPNGSHYPEGRARAELCAGFSATLAKRIPVSYVNERGTGYWEIDFRFALITESQA